MKAFFYLRRFFFCILNNHFKCWKFNITLIEIMNKKPIQIKSLVCWKRNNVVLCVDILKIHISNPGMYSNNNFFICSCLYSFFYLYRDTIFWLSFLKKSSCEIYSPYTSLPPHTITIYFDEFLRPNDIIIQKRYNIVLRNRQSPTL